MTAPNPGRLITSLEAELFPPQGALYQTLLIHGLFSRRIGLSNSHALDNLQVAEFMRENEHILETEEVDERKSPFLGICGNVGAELRKAVDLYLRPKGSMGKPTYLTSLRPEDNLRLGEKYDEVNEEDRWQRFESVVDPELVKHIDRATRYFKRHPQAVVPRTQEGGFFDSVRKALTRLDRRQLSRVDLKVLDSMFETMERWNPAEGCQSRERLHEAIYNGNTPPRVWRGEVQQPSYEIDHASDREGWRYLIDALSNEHHAQMHGWEVLAQLVGVSPQP